MVTTLVVSDRHSVREEVGNALAEAGHDVMACPGPRPPDYACVGGCKNRCALAHGCDLVVLDADLGSDLRGVGTSSWDLLNFYRGLGIPIVVLAEGEDLPGWVPTDRIAYLPRSAPGRSVVSAVNVLVDTTPASHGADDRAAG